MNKNRRPRILLSEVALVAVMSAPRPAPAQDAKQPYPTMAPVEQYLMNRDAEIALARSAAPDAISHDASVIVLTRHGYETAVEGKNGWVCWVGRGWMAMFDHPEFWNRKVRRKAMNRNQIHSILLSAFAIVVTLIASRPAAAQETKQPYPAMAPIGQYLMNRDAEIALARSAAPDAISHDATVLVLTRRGYQTAVEGKNGWVCMVERGWMAMFDSPEFWNPKVRGANCLNPPAARSILPFANKRTQLLLAGHSKVEVIAAIKAALDKKELPAVEPGAVCYMMAKSSYLTDNGDNNGPHLMFYESLKDDAAWGANMANSPVVSVNYWYMSAEAYPQLKSFPPMAVFAVVVDKWSDGTLAPSMKRPSGKR